MREAVGTLRIANNAGCTKLVSSLWGKRFEAKKPKPQFLGGQHHSNKEQQPNNTTAQQNKEQLLKDHKTPSEFWMLSNERFGRPSLKPVVPTGPPAGTDAHLPVDGAGAGQELAEGLPGWLHTAAHGPRKKDSAIDQMKFQMKKVPWGKKGKYVHT